MAHAGVGLHQFLVDPGCALERGTSGEPGGQLTLVVQAQVSGEHFLVHGNVGVGLGQLVIQIAGAERRRGKRRDR